VTSTVRDNPEETRYEIVIDDDVAGFVVYRRMGEAVALVHTEVEPALEGEGVGSELVRATLDDLRTRGERIRPVCPFVSAYIDRHPEYRDLVA
jgi:uncharacterized protein